MGVTVGVWAAPTAPAGAKLARGSSNSGLPPGGKRPEPMPPPGAMALGPMRSAGAWLAAAADEDDVDAVRAAFVERPPACESVVLFRRFRK